MSIVVTKSTIVFFFNGKSIINNKPVSAQDEQRSGKTELQYNGAVYKRNTNEKSQKQT
jgi:hypothetical protein